MTFSIGGKAPFTRIFLDRNHSLPAALDDAGQVGPDGAVGVHGAPAGDGVGDGQVLGQ
jgi:hypothetical protein